MLEDTEYLAFKGCVFSVASEALSLEVSEQRESSTASSLKGGASARYGVSYHRLIRGRVSDMEPTAIA